MKNKQPGREFVALGREWEGHGMPLGMVGKTGNGTHGNREGRQAGTTEGGGMQCQQNGKCMQRRNWGGGRIRKKVPGNLNAQKCRACPCLSQCQMGMSNNAVVVGKRTRG